MVFDPILFEFSKVFRQFHVIFLTHDIFFDSFIALDLFEDRVRVVIDDIDDHPILCSIGGKSLHFLSHLSDEIAFSIFELELSK